MLYQIVVKGWFLIMGGREKNLEDLMQSDQDIRKTRYGRKRFFRNQALIFIAQISRVIGFIYRAHASAVNKIIKVPLCRCISDSSYWILNNF